MQTKLNYWEAFGGAEKAANTFSSELSFRVRLGELFGETKVETWLHTPNAAFNNKRPIDLIHKGDVDPLYEMIYRVESGEPS